MMMQLDEAMAVRAKALQGVRVQEHILKQAMQVITVQAGIAHAARINGGMIIEPINQVQRERLNAILAYKLALACGKLNEWR
jgi:hypothetical protein